MSEDRPSPPPEVPTDLAQRLTDCSVVELRAVADHASALAEYRERTERLEEKDSQPAPENDDRPEDVPTKATVTVKEINDNRYYYWQWREGDQVKSRYKGPANPDR